MIKFNYKVFDENFNVVKSSLDANSEDEANSTLTSKGYTLIKLERKKTFPLFSKRKILSTEELATFCGELATILSSGVSILSGLKIIQNDNPKLQKVIFSISNDIKKGDTLSSSMERTGVFPRLLIDVAISGELSGNLDEIFYSMETFYERETSIKNKIKNAAIYPIILFISTIVLITFFNIFIFPKLKGIFGDLNSLPLVTKLLLNSNSFFADNLAYIAIILLTIYCFILYLKRYTNLNYKLHKLLLKLPIVGSLSLCIATCRFTRTMGIFLRSAVPLSEALENLGSIIGNAYISEEFKSLKQDVLHGYAIGESLYKLNIFDPLVIQMIRVGEETGTLQEMFNKLESIYDKKTDIKIQKMLALVEPVFTLVIGAIISFVILALAYPILKMSSVIK